MQETGLQSRQNSPRTRYSMHLVNWCQNMCFLSSCLCRFLNAYFTAKCSHKILCSIWLLLFSLPALLLQPLTWLSDNLERKEKTVRTSVLNPDCEISQLYGKTHYVGTLYFLIYIPHLIKSQRFLKIQVSQLSQDSRPIIQARLVAREKRNRE